MNGIRPKLKDDHVIFAATVRDLLKLKGWGGSGNGVGTGRPPKLRAPKNEATFSQEDVHKMEALITKFLATKAQRSHFTSLIGESTAAISKALAHELMVYPAMQGLVADKAYGRRGPKPKDDHATFVATVRDILNSHGVNLKAWSNTRDPTSQLTDFCTALFRVAKLQTGVVSARTARKLPVKGFSSE
ncbi:MAG: hypothetical protein KA740_06625 [Rhodoferax sp.]|jgi:hypothetical protein|nr:hypothetical protein [Rhodoferax sp.]